jgi:hypothetical protein
VEAVTHDQHGTPVEFSQVLYQADRFRFEIESHPQHGVGFPSVPSSQGVLRGALISLSTKKGIRGYQLVAG